MKSTLGSKLKKLHIGYVYLSRLNRVRLEKSLTFVAFLAAKRDMDYR